MLTELWPYLLTPFICGLIGWVTNYLAVKMLFHPRKPVNILGVTVQGVFPKRQKHLAMRLGEMIERELICAADIREALVSGGISEEARAAVGAYAEKLLREDLIEAIPMAKMFLNDSTVTKLKGVLVPRLEKALPHIISAAACGLEENMAVSHMVRSKVEQFSLDKLEEVLFAILRSEFRFIELVGGVLGFVIGVFQSLFFYLAR